MNQWDSGRECCFRHSGLPLWGGQRDDVFPAGGLRLLDPSPGLVEVGSKGEERHLAWGILFFHHQVIDFFPVRFSGFSKRDFNSIRLSFNVFFNEFLGCDVRFWVVSVQGDF